MGETVPGCNVEYAAGGSPDTRCYRVDFSKITRVLPDFKPQWTARKGAKELYKAVQRAGLHLDDFEGPRYKRISLIQQFSVAVAWTPIYAGVNGHGAETAASATPNWRYQAAAGLNRRAERLKLSLVLKLDFSDRKNPRKILCLGCSRR